jgi:cyclopropane fatty-acyl-phospholipid synthase-like methyltransferase
MIIVSLVVLFLLLGFAVSSISGAPWVPARSYDIEVLLDDADMKPGDIYIELGCGDGRLVRAAAQRGFIAIGYELNPLLWAIAWARSLGHKNTHIRLGNFWHQDISQADVVMAFLVPRTMPRLGRKAEKEMKKGARLISYIFPIEHKKHSRKHRSWYIYTF